MFKTGAKCDKCGYEKYADGIHSKEIVIRNLRKAGWTVGKYTKCPKCKPKPKKHEIL